MLRTIQYNGQNGYSHKVVETSDLFVIRTTGGNPHNLLKEIPGLKPFQHNIVQHDQFPESNVFVFRVAGSANPESLRDEIKNSIEIYHHPKILFAGTVMCYADSGIYQLYTNNLFIKFYKEVKECAISRIIEKHNLNVKRKIGFAANAYFVNARSEIGRDIFDQGLELLYLPEVEYCHPELVAKRKNVYSDIPGNLTSIKSTPENWVFSKINLFEAWKYTRGKNVIICVIDDGLEYNHPAFSSPGKIIAYRDMLDKTCHLFPRHQFDEMHGTACAGIACSADPRVPGMAPEARLIPVRSVGLGSVLESEAFYWAANKGAHIISCSWGPPDGDFRVKNHKEVVFPIPDHTNLAIHYAGRKGRNGLGCLIFFAAGNGNEKIISDQYASHPQVMAIGATNLKDEKVSYGDYDSPLFCSFPSGDYAFDGKEWKQLYGVAVPDRLGKSGYDATDVFKLFTGTSASCPGMAGIAALLLSVRPQLTARQAREILAHSCKHLGKISERGYNGYHPMFGYGLIQADLVIKNALQFSNNHFKSNIMNNKIQKPRGYSLHIGINNVSPDYYGNYVPPLSGCINDMTRMKELASSLNYETSSLKDEEATRENILKCIAEFGSKAGPGDIVLITYAGHGAPVPDENNDEIDRYDEAWVTYNGFLLDDELYAACKAFNPETRILMVSDSCHSGTMNRMVNFHRVRNTNGGRKLRFIDITAVKGILLRHNKNTRGLKTEENRGHALPDEVKAPFKLLAACQDDQYAQEMGENGLFTTKLMETLDKHGRNTLSYGKLIEFILEQMPPDQRPQIKNEGTVNMEFDEQIAFTISSSESQMKSKPEIVRKKKARATFITVETSESLLNVNPSQSKRTFRGKKVDTIKVIGGQVDADDLEGETDWDKAYNLYFANQDKKIDFIETNLPSVPLDENYTEVRNAETKSTDDTGWLLTYPPHKDVDTDVPFDWHLDNEHSELKAAREMVYPELITGDNFDKSRPNVRIAHIDTGFYPQHPSRPVNIKLAATVDGDDITGEGEDKDVKYYVKELQGHGNATLAILAGGLLTSNETAGEFSGYFGGIPYAEVVPIKISESVVLLSGRRFERAIEYAIEQQVDVITLSMSGWPSKALARAVNKAYEAGIVICAAASNSWVKGGQALLPDSMLYPARFDRTIGVVGATYNQKPYIFDIHNPQFRTAGGTYMQMSYGPDSAMQTAIAGYTPNIIWFDIDKKDADNGVCFVKNGGGTSSATPQVAAAAALYIQQHRSEINKIAGADKWKKVEIVKAALFNSAYKIDKYSEYYGNGILRAKAALMRKPAEFEGIIKKAPEARVEGTFLHKLFFIYQRGLAATTRDERLTDMMTTELLQLMHREPELFRFLKMDFSEPQDRLKDESFRLKLKEKDIELLVSVVQKSKLASKFLKNHLVTYGLSDKVSIPRNLIFEAPNINVVEFQSNIGKYNLRTSGLNYEIKRYRNNIYQDTITHLNVDEIELEIEHLADRGDGVSMNLLTNFEAEGRQGALLIEHDFNGETAFEWVFNKQVSGKIDSTTRNLLFSNERWAEEARFEINFQRMATVANRNLFGKIGKVVIKIISWLKPPEISKKIKESLAELFESEYGVMCYDLQKPTGQGWFTLEPRTNSGIWKSIMEETSKPVLMLFPGLFRDVKNSFDDFLSIPRVGQEFSQQYCRYVIGFNMPDVVAGIRANAAEINQLIPNEIVVAKPCVVLARSRGGIVARYLFEQIWGSAKKSDKNPFLLQKMLMISTPNEGTPAASNEKWRDLVNIVCNILGKAFTIGSPVFKGIQTLIAAIVNQITDLDGINDLEVNSDLLQELNKTFSQKKDSYYIIASDYEPKNVILRFIEDIAVDRYVFTGTTNDGVVPVRSVICESDSKTGFIPRDNRLLLGSTERMHHFSSFDPSEDGRITDWILQNLRIKISTEPTTTRETAMNV